MNLTYLLTSTTTTSGLAGNKTVSIVLMVGLFVVMYFVMIRPQKKKQKDEQEMRDAIQIGDEITTIGGIMGRVVTVKEDSLVIETGADRIKMKISRWAIQTNDTANSRMDAERKAAEEAKKAKGEQDAIDEAVNGKGHKRRKSVVNKGDAEADAEPKIENISDALSEDTGDTSSESVEKNNE